MSKEGEGNTKLLRLFLTFVLLPLVTMLLTLLYALVYAFSNNAALTQKFL
jgi:hypothetical protein